MYPYIITSNSVTVVADSILTMTATHPDYSSVLAHIRAGNWDEAVLLMTPRKAVESWVDSNVTIGSDDKVYYKGQPVSNAVVPVILKMRSEGFDCRPLMQFLKRLQGNPSMRSRDQLWRFVESNSITITSEGMLLFYKKVRSDWYDCHTGKTHKYEPGSVHTMPRPSVDDDPEKTCSAGLHVCSLSYLSAFAGDRTILVEVCPEDVVAVPIDYQNSKVRVSRLRVVREIDSPVQMRTVEDSDSVPF